MMNIKVCNKTSYCFSSIHSKVVKLNVIQQDLLGDNTYTDKNLHNLYECHNFFNCTIKWSSIFRFKGHTKHVFLDLIFDLLNTVFRSMW